MTSIEALIADAVAERIAAELEATRAEVVALRELVEHGPTSRRRLSRAQAAKHYLCSTRTIDSWMANGCPCLRLGGPGGSPRLDVDEGRGCDRKRSRDSARPGALIDLNRSDTNRTLLGGSRPFTAARGKVGWNPSGILLYCAPNSTTELSVQSYRFGVQQDPTWDHVAFLLVCLPLLCWR